ncbi:MAG: nucleotidyl transferase AbiEii/AbiGii toxin family protein [Burkholderiaceae bacterium]|jgi:hypothetical protein|nr:nucleotidyl transferase AbiEii/AbiGii toxin family protein [Burkholderiaceae bacterium]
MPEFTEHYFDLSLAEQAELKCWKKTPGCAKCWAFCLRCRIASRWRSRAALSKVYQAIERFSEDIDVTINYRSLVADLAGLSNTQRKKSALALTCASAPSG